MLPVGMSEVAVVNFYACANVLLVAAAAALAAIRAVSGALPRPLTYRHLLVMGRVLAVAALLLPLVALWHGGNELSPLRAQVWSAPSMRADAAAIPDSARIDLGVNSQHASVSVEVAAGVALLLFTAGLFVTLLPLFSEARATLRIIRSAHALRRAGSVRILVSDQEPVPFAAWIPGRFYIVLPAALLLRPTDLRLALRHEGQHHRQHDTLYVYAMLLGRALFGLNPAVHWLSRQLFGLQEFACDEALAGRAGHCARTYCACLLQVAEAALPLRQTQLRSFMVSHPAFALARRIEAALQRPARPLRAPAAVGVSLVAIGLLAALSAAIAAPVQDRRLSRADVERLAAIAPTSSGFPLRVNDAVVAQLNLLLATPDGRAYLSASLARMHDFEPGILTELKRYGLPAELLAVPLVESGYRNLPARNGLGAGLWMFIAPTARYYGLETSARRDERMDVQAETQAAMRMFTDLHGRFQDWPLALLAYNAGVSRVEAGMSATHSRDAWRLYQAGYGNEPDYLARTTAVMLILSHTELLD